MGCDVFWSGSEADQGLQTGAIDFVKGFFEGENFLLINPVPEQQYNTLILRKTDERAELSYPFNFFGVAPFFEEDFKDAPDILSRGQFVFDRTDEGRLVSMYKLPPEITGLKKDKSNEGYEVHIKDSAYIRLGDSFSLAFLLNIIKLRYVKNLSIGDDYNNCKSIEKNINKFGLKKKLRKEDLAYDEALKLYLSFR